MSVSSVQSIFLAESFNSFRPDANIVTYKYLLVTGYKGWTDVF